VGNAATTTLSHAQTLLVLDRLAKLAGYGDEQARELYKELNHGYPPDVPNGFREWGSIEFPQWLQDLGFSDRSYRNDLCGRAFRGLAGYDAVKDDGPRLVAWVDHERLEDREDGGPQFQISYHAVSMDEDEVIIYAGDDAQECAKLVAQWLADHQEVIRG
jgi:hypothetical protein